MAVAAVGQDPSRELPAPLYLPMEATHVASFALPYFFIIFFHLNIFLLLSE